MQNFCPHTDGQGSKKRGNPPFNAFEGKVKKSSRLMANGRESSSFYGKTITATRNYRIPGKWSGIMNGCRWQQSSRQILSAHTHIQQ